MDKLQRLTAGKQAFAGLVLWLGFVAWVRPGVQHHEWAQCILLLAALVWVPLIPVIAHGIERIYMFLASFSLVVAFLLPQGWWAGALALPWLVVTLWQFGWGIQMLYHQRHGAGWIAISAGRIFMVVGGLWTLSDRLGWQPLDFSREIVLLTGVHFHYAGLIFTTLAGLLATHWPTAAARFACWLAVISVPLTAIGITLAQMQVSFFFETVAAALVALAGWLTAFGYARVALFKSFLPWLTRVCWVFLAISLAFTMTLAFGYAIRPYYTIEVLHLPFMRAWHGTLNAFGVAGAGLIGSWRMQVDIDETLEDQQEETE